MKIYLIVIKELNEEGHFKHMCYFIQQILARYDHVQGCKANIYFEEFIRGKMDKKAKEKRTDTM